MPVAPVIALSHGGGPLPVLDDPEHKSIIYSLKNRVPKILGLGTPSQPRAIVLVTAHWTTGDANISSGKTHELVYDYYNFPPVAYTFKYPAPGEPDVARSVKAAFDAEGLPAELNGERGWDHGLYIPMMLVHPEADIPMVQVSVLQSEDPETHLRMGAALSRLRADNIAVVGSGFASFHNLATMRALRTVSADQRAAFKAESDVWNAALAKAVTAKDKSARWQGLKAWRQMPHADKMHPPNGGEHFMPLIVCTGAAGDDEEAKTYKDTYLGVDIYTFYWGGEQVG
ncbi:catalytic ligB subunit of aromatic ring-opening dioxygenase [Hirsutella rhossiliensis]|uniref:Catalytic ligB subunit of aromatic ring-opening dioxygenase domain-containing protein n=1 Tax=Hirsutella rhossiliensis TaxID=111463 RepID=A0A9P8MTR6_9HYPO|nr:catalytic ligB subunit of aromatic ring-opening dioxygenase domain-containing protein [Hirsutella rhossiliensis]KAH0960269.1 catalytic ligB subunit of aromatic ring-opening dioxygenase domain-containing protein [Hirsutella rhossiliensis]